MTQADVRSRSPEASGDAARARLEQRLRLDQQIRAENFPVALRVLPPRVRGHLRVVYDVVRTIDDLGDRAAGDRTAALHGFAADLETVWTTGSPTHPVLQRLQATTRDCGLTAEPFRRLVAANLQDQTVASYASFGDLRAYCRLSADPVGHLVLAVFDATTPRAVDLSDRVCTGLQIIEHCQDVAEDRRAGRVYLPQDDLAAFGVSNDDLDRPHTSPALQRLVAFETGRAVALLRQGAPLVSSLRGWARLAVAGYLAGGLAAADGLRRSRYDVLATSPGVRRRDLLRHLGTALVARP